MAVWSRDDPVPVGCCGYRKHEHALAQRFGLHGAGNPGIVAGMEAVAIYTDGACSGNPGPGGCAAVVVRGDRRTELAQGYRWTTNNRMELAGAILALRTLAERAQVEIHTDSQYVAKAFQENWILRWKANGWRTAAKTAVRNVDLWQALDAELAKHAARFRWVKGHAGHPENTRCDALAVAAGQGAELLVDGAFEQEHPRPSAGGPPSRPVVPRGETLELF